MLAARLTQIEFPYLLFVRSSYECGMAAGVCGPWNITAAMQWRAGRLVLGWVMYTPVYRPTWVGVPTGVLSGAFGFVSGQLVSNVSSEELAMPSTASGHRLYWHQPQSPHVCINVYIYIYIYVRVDSASWVVLLCLSFSPTHGDQLLIQPCHRFRTTHAASDGRGGFQATADIYI